MSLRRPTRGRRRCHDRHHHKDHARGVRCGSLVLAVKGFLAAVQQRILAERETMLATASIIEPPPHAKGGRPRVSPERIARVISLRDSGKSHRAIAAATGLTQRQVARTLGEAKKTVERPILADYERKERDASIAAMTREGLSASQIAVQFGISVRTVVRVRSQSTKEQRHV